MIDAEQEKLLDDLAEQLLERWRNGEQLTTLNLRGACHAAQRGGDEEAERKISREIGDREELGR
jgi:uncharacterized protein HemY